MFNYLGSYKLGGWIMLWHRYDTYTQINSNKMTQSFPGMYLVAGMVARNIAGPGVIFSFMIAAVASIFSGELLIKCHSIEIINIPNCFRGLLRRIRSQSSPHFWISLHVISILCANIRICNFKNLSGTHTYLLANLLHLSLDGT